NRVSRRQPEPAVPGVPEVAFERQVVAAAYFHSGCIPFRPQLWPTRTVVSILSPCTIIFPRNQGRSFACKAGKRGTIDGHRGKWRRFRFSGTEVSGSLLGTRKTPAPLVGPQCGGRSGSKGCRGVDRLPCLETVTPSCVWISGMQAGLL